jgi:beta-glucosidase
MSDCGAIEDQFEDKHTASSYADAAAQSISAGTDWCMGTDFLVHTGISDAVAQGLLNVSQVDAALARTLSVRFRLGLFDPPAFASAFPTYGVEHLNSAASRQAAEEAAAMGAVLLRNGVGADGKPVLPIDISSPALKTIAVVGPHAVTQRDLLGDFYADASVMRSERSPLEARTQSARSPRAVHGAVRAHSARCVRRSRHAKYRRLRSRHVRSLRSLCP